MPTLHCPFCGAAEAERLRLEESLVVVFPCMFSPVLGASAKEEELPSLLAAYAKEGSQYFQRQCDRLHYFVMKGKDAVLPGAPGGRETAARS